MKNKAAKTAWDALTPSRKKEVLHYFAALQSPEAQSRNVARMLHVLSGKPGYFLARAWRSGS
jgi:hypothetical protein